MRPQLAGRPGLEIVYSVILGNCLCIGIIIKSASISLGWLGCMRRLAHIPQQGPPSWLHKNLYKLFLHFHTKLVGGKQSLHSHHLSTQNTPTTSDP